MPNEEHLSYLKDGIKSWNKWRQECRHIIPDLSEADLFRTNLGNADLSNTNLSKANLSEANLSWANLSGAYLPEANLSGANLSGASLCKAYLPGANLFKVNFTAGASLNKANLSGANLSWATLSEADLSGADLSGTKFIGADLFGANLYEVNLTGADLSKADLSGANLSKVDLSWADLSWANLVNADLDKANFYYVKIHKTYLQGIHFSPEHPVLSDRSDTIRLIFRERHINWTIIRSVGRFPLFGISWTSLVITLTIINAIGSINENRLIEAINYPIQIPGRMMLFLVSSLLLVIGSTLYKFACPVRVQEFSETEWVEVHKHPRLQYIAEKLRRRWLQWPTLIFSVAGAFLALLLIAEQVWRAFKYISGNL